MVTPNFLFGLHSSRKNLYPLHGRSLEIPRGRGVVKVKILEAKYEAKLEFPGGGMGGANKKPSMGGVWVFSGTVHSNGLSKDMLFPHSYKWRKNDAVLGDSSISPAA